MIVLLPISRYKVSYRTAEGVPHSQLEGLMMRAMAEGVQTLNDVEDTFAIHRRLLIQALVGLIQEGYVALGSGSRYLLTDDGEAIAAGEQRHRVRETPERSTTVVMERLVGLVAPSREVRYVGRRETEELVAPPQIPPRRHDPRLDPAQVRHLVPKGPDEWVRSIDDVRLIARGANWLPVRVDAQNRRILGVPDRWMRLLTPVLLEAAPTESVPTPDPFFERQLVLGEPRGGLAEDLGGGAYVDIDGADVIDDTEAGEVLERVLSEATETVIIAAPIGRVATVMEARAAIVAALERGVDVHLLAAGVDETARAEIERLAFDLRDTRFRVVVSPEAGHVSAVVWKGYAGWSAIVGAIGWLGAAPSGSGLIVRHPDVVGMIAETVASAWRSLPGQSLSSVPGRWSQLAAELEASGVGRSSGATRVRIAVGGEAESVLSEGGTEIGPRACVGEERCAVGWWRGDDGATVALELVGEDAGLLAPMPPS
jgi:hypothetical protein